jgi:uncharacterized Fe-S radical SAM superfamily protein PflX
MRKDRIFSGIIITIAILLSLLSLAAEHKERPTKAFMRQKLVYSQGILEGLTLEKYELVITNANLLRNMTLTNSFTKMADPYYAKCIKDFQTRVDVVIKGARNKLLDGTTEAYSKMLESCVACHKECRVEQFRGENPRE